MSNILRISSAELPTAFGSYIIHLFQDTQTAIEHVALVMGNVDGQEDVLTRMHSECLTGDIFSSRRCDCGEQLTLAQELIAKEGVGVIVYLRNHEGRGIGLANKIRAYALQDQGLDTVDANIALGLPVDNRTFDIGAEILRSLGIKSIRLLSNNPSKCESLKAEGTHINSIVPLKIPANSDNFKYIQTKKVKLGHLYN